MASANVIIAQLLFLESENPNKEISFYIQSPGGEVSAGLAILDTMKYIKSPVSTIAVGLAASMGAVLLAAGDKRFALPHTDIMIHQPLGGAQGQITDMEIQLKQGLKAKKVLTELLAQYTKKPVETLLADMERDNYMTAAEAKEYGLIDEILEKKI